MITDVERIFTGLCIVRSYGKILCGYFVRGGMTVLIVLFILILFTFQ